MVTDGASGWSRSGQDAATTAHLAEAQALLSAGRYEPALSALVLAEASFAGNPAQLEELLERARSVRTNTDEAEVRAGCDVVIARVHTRLGLPIPTPRFFREGIPVVTSNEIPGFEIVDYVGEVYGVVVRSRDAVVQLGAKLKSIVGGEIETMTNLLRDTRRVAIDRMVEEAEARGADAIIAMRLEVTEMNGNWTEICAYGTAVHARQADISEYAEPPT
jgi:Uncharacterized conserved protein